MIEVRDVTHRYAERDILRGVSATLTEHRIAVIGAMYDVATGEIKVLDDDYVNSRGVADASTKNGWMESDFPSDGAQGGGIIAGAASPSD